MLRGLYTAAMGMINNQAKEDISSNNISNSSTPGYKQDRLVSQPFHEVMLQNRDGSRDGAVQQLGTMPFGVEAEGIYTDFVQGVPQDTGRDLDFALDGKGLFAVQYPDANGYVTKYTRDGSFMLDSGGMLITSDGGYVLGRDESGQAGPMNIGSGKVTVDSQGNLAVDSVNKYTLEIYDFDDYNNLEKTGNSMYSLKDSNVSPITLDSGEFSVKQGSLEQSNVDLTSEMVNMIANIRSYQANQRVLQSIDGTLAKAVNEVGSLK